MDVSHNNSDRGTPLLCFQPVTSLDYGLMATLPSPSPMQRREEPFLSEVHSQVRNWAPIGAQWEQIDVTHGLYRTGVWLEQ